MAPNFTPAESWAILCLVALAAAGVAIAAERIAETLEDWVGGWLMRRRARRVIAQVMLDRAWRHKDAR